MTQPSGKILKFLKAAKLLNEIQSCTDVILSEIKNVMYEYIVRWIIMRFVIEILYFPIYDSIIGTIILHIMHYIFQPYELVVDFSEFRLKTKIPFLIKKKLFFINFKKLNIFMNC